MHCPSCGEFFCVRLRAQSLCYSMFILYNNKWRVANYQLSLHQAKGVHPWSPNAIFCKPRAKGLHPRVGSVVTKQNNYDCPETVQYHVYSTVIIRLWTVPARIGLLRPSTSPLLNVNYIGPYRRRIGAAKSPITCQPKPRSVPGSVSCASLNWWEECGRARTRSTYSTRVCAVRCTLLCIAIQYTYTGLGLVV